MVFFFLGGVFDCFADVDRSIADFFFFPTAALFAAAFVAGFFRFCGLGGGAGWLFAAKRVERLGFAFAADSRNKRVRAVSR